VQLLMCCVGVRVPCRTLRVPVADVVTPGHVITVPGEGLPRQDGTKVSCGGWPLLLLSVHSSCLLYNS
jgi:hypothetical protein